MKKSLTPVLFSIGILLLLGVGSVLVACLSGGAAEAPAPSYTRSTPAARSHGVPKVETPLSVETPRDTVEVRRAVTRALPYLERHGVAWMEEHGCVSCHQIPSMLWSYNEAAARHLPVDRAQLDEWNRWAFEKSLEVGTSNSDGFHQMILGSPDRLEEEESALARLIARAQEPDGSWQAGGQLPLQRRPAEESHRVSSLWSLLALAAVGGEDDALERGREQVEAHLDEPGESHEWSIVRLLYAHRFGDRERVEEWLGQVLSAQNEDGGWAWIHGEPSDAFATGQTLYALERLGRSGSDARVEKGRRFLLESQQDDGSWAVRSTLRREHGPTPTSNFWGTGWAVVGLLRSLPPAHAASAPAA